MHATRTIPRRRRNAFASRIVGARITAVAAVATLVASVVVGGLALAADGTRHGIFLETLDVDLVNVEIVATQNGQPVTDLTREDFEVFDDGKPVEITNYYQVLGGRRVEPQPTSDEPGHPPVAPALAPEPIDLVVLVDDMFVGLSSRKQILQALQPKLAELMDEGTRVMVASKDYTIDITQPFTSDPAEVEAAVEVILNRSGAASLHDTQERNLLRQLSLSALPGQAGGSRDEDQGELDANILLQSARQNALEQLQMVRRSVGVLATFLDSLAGMPGKKAVIYVSDGLPRYPGQTVFDAWYARFGNAYGDQMGVGSVVDAAQDFDANAEIKALIADANANGVAMYPVGLGARAENRNLNASMRNAQVASTYSSQAVSDLAEGLERLAEGTGGRTSIDRLDVDLLFEHLAQDLDNRYSIGFPSPHGADGKTHRLEVRVKRPGIDLRYPRSYRDKGADRQMQDRTLAALLHGASANPLDVRVLIGDGESAKKKNTFELPVEVRWPMANITLLPGETTHRGSVTVFIVARDSGGGLSEPTKIIVPIEIKNADLLTTVTQVATYRTRLLVRAGEQVVAVGVRDDVGGRDATVRVDVEVGGRG